MLIWSKLSPCFISHNTVIWGFESSGVWRCVVGRVTTDISTDCVAFIFKGQALFLDEHTPLLQSVGEHSHNDAASHPGRPAPLATQLCMGFVINSQQTPSPENPWRPRFAWTWSFCSGCRSFLGCTVIRFWPMRTGYCYTGLLLYSKTIICHFLLLFHCACAQLAEWTMLMQ